MIKEYTLGDCVEKIIDYRGKTPQKMGGDWVNNGYRVISALNVHGGFIDNEDQIRCVSQEIYEKWMKDEIKRNDCFLASEGASLGENTIWDSDEKIVLGQRLYAIRTNPDKLDPWYFAMYMQTKKFRQQIDQISTGSTVFGISQPVLLGVKLLLPNIVEQRKIGALYRNIYHKLKNNNSICSDLESMAKLLYDYWFVQFDFPDENGRPYKSSGGKMVWNDELKREIPEGWEVQPLSHFIADSKNGDWGNEKSKKTSDICVNCFRGADFASITNDYHMTAPVRYISAKNKDRLLSDGDLVTEISGGSPTQATGRIGYINKGFLDRSENDMTCSNFCKAFTPYDKSYQYWLYQTWKFLYDIGAMFNYESKTTGIKNLMFDEFVAWNKVPEPNRELALLYQKESDLYYGKIQSLLIENQELASLRDFLLPMLMNGQIKIEDVKAS